LIKQLALNNNIVIILGLIRVIPIQSNPTHYTVDS